MLNTTPSPASFSSALSSRGGEADGHAFLVTHGTLVDRYGVHVALEAFARLVRTDIAAIDGVQITGAGSFGGT